ncbi:MAG: FAD-linked oxidase C-terminal domain-containing protein [Acidobacteriaceae bacterium]
MSSHLVNIGPLPPSSHAIPVDQFPAAEALERKLKRNIKGEVRFDAGSRALYATDASNYRQIPIGLVVPKTLEDVIATIAACREFDAPVLSRGGGTSLAGQCCNVAVVIDFSKYLHQILELDFAGKIARVQPGLVLDTLRDAAEVHQLTFAPDPATHNRCTIGGMLGNNSCGVHALMGGKSVDNTETLDILLYDGTRMTVGQTSDGELEQIIRAGGRKGEIYSKLRELRDKYGDEIRKRYPKIPRRVSGYNLDSLLPENGFHIARALVGSEGTCVTVLEAKLRLMPSPQYRTLVVLGYSDAYSAADHVPEILQYRPIGLEGFDQTLVRDIRSEGKDAQDLALFPQGGGYLMVEFGGDTQGEADALAKKMTSAIRGKENAPTMKLYDDKKQESEVWKVREAGLGATAFVPGKPPAWSGWEDAAVPPEKLGAYLREFRALLQKFDYTGALYGHFGQGCIHTRIDFKLDSAEGIRHYRDFIDHAADLVIQYGGSLSGEHGDGQSRAALLPKMFGADLVRAFAEFKAIWDPTNRMNPHKVVDPYQPEENLRLGTDYRPWEPKTHFSFQKDGNSFARAALRCVGVGECRRHDEGTMCPSYMVTREERHSTRGRAHLLFEMAQGEIIHDGWKSEAVKEALDLCLSCKGCTGECPVEVDLPTYKAEFMSHYYEGRMRPFNAYAFGFIDRWAQFSSIAPELVNLFTQSPVSSRLTKAVAGIPRQRRIPAFAPYSFMQWVRRNKVNQRSGGKNDVLLWPDTFNNYFHPQTARAAVEVLENAGFSVRVPEQHVCCGRPLYDFGFLKEAKRYLRRNLEVVRESVDNGMPVVVLEPSCASVFRDEMLNLIPNDEVAKRLHDQTFLLSEFLEHHASGYAPPKLRRKMLVHGHCHHKALMKMTDEKSLLKKMEADIELPDSGCCGMAGPFGFEREKYDVSIAAGERVLLPAVRKQVNDTIIIADGFSCREQIAQQTDRHALHLADALKLALDHGENGPPGKPEAGALAEIRRARRQAQVKTLAAIVLSVAAASYLFRRGWLRHSVGQRRASGGAFVLLSRCSDYAEPPFE